MATEQTHSTRLSSSTATPSLSSDHYLDPTLFEQELALIWRKQWLYLDRLGVLQNPGDFQVYRIAGREIIVTLNEASQYKAFFNVCRHRGSVLCEAESGHFNSGRIICPYHQWSYTLDGAQAGTPRVNLAVADGALDLHPVLLRSWAGNLYVNLDSTATGTIEDVMIPGPKTLEHWPLAQLSVGHRSSFVINCNWKIFWENYLECYHCPAIHPELCRIVPLYQAGLSTELINPEHPATDSVAAGIESWTSTGRAIAAPFATLNEAERAAGHTFLELYPNQYIVAHSDYVRQVCIQPLSVTQTQITAEWLFSEDALADPNFDARPATDFGELVLEQDTRVCELNQRGLNAASAFQGVLVDLEADVVDFHQKYRKWMNQ